MWVIGAEILGMAAYLSYEAHRHRRTLAEIPIRIHVNGTRGKSSVTRLIASGMRAGGYRTVAKTTGTKPRFIFPDGAEAPIARAGKPNIIEQVRIVRRARDQGAQALVIECMAVKPELQKVAEDKLIRATVGVITNVRADHLDEMGPTVTDVARALAGTTPRRGILFTAEPTHLGPLIEQAHRRESAIAVSRPDAVTDAMMAGFTYFEHKENVALALAVTGWFGIDSDSALAGMHAATPDPGALRIHNLNIFGTSITFVNAFAANDPDSYRILWERLAPWRPREGKLVALVTCRKDRISRAEQLAQFIATGVEADQYFICGESTRPVHQAALGLGMNRAGVHDFGGRDAAWLFEQVLEVAEHRPVMVIGVGNIVGLGEELALYFQHRGEEVVYRGAA
jgi:poly-gamma-glutamate synthase PgsB/CapB